MNLPGIGELIKKSFDFFIKHIQLFIVLSLFASIPTLISTVLTSVIGEPKEELGIGAALGILGVVGLITILSLIVNFIFVSMAQIGSLQIASGQSGQLLTFQNLFQKFKSKFWTLSIVNFLSGIIVLFGFMLLIIPGIIFVFWYIYSSFVYLDQGLTGMDALNKSKEITEGYRMNIFVYSFVFGLISFGIIFIPVVVLSFIPIVGQLVSTVISNLLTIWGVIYSALLYLHIRDAKKSAPTAPVPAAAQAPTSNK